MYLTRKQLTEKQQTTRISLKTMSNLKDGTAV